MSKIFHPALTVERRGKNIVFKQGEDESLYTAWERFKRLLKRCPMHGIDMTTQIDIFYHAMNYTSKGIIDASCWLLKTLPNATTRLHLNLQGAAAG